MLKISITGTPRSGKTTVALIVGQALRDRRYVVEHLDDSDAVKYGKLGPPNTSEARSVQIQSESVDYEERGPAGVTLEVPSIQIVQPVGNCDGSGLYKDDPSKETRRGEKLSQRCPGCRACR